MRLITKRGVTLNLSDFGINESLLSSLKYDIGSYRAQQILKKLHGQCWLVCNCTKFDADAALLTIRANPNKTFSLVNISGRGKHKPDCMLSYERIASHLSNHNQTAIDIIDPKQLSSLALLSKVIIERAKLNILSESSTYNNNKESVLNIGTHNILINGQPFGTLFNFGFRSFFSLRDAPSPQGDFILEVVDEVHDENGTVTLKDANTGHKRFSFFRNLTDVYIKEDIYPSENGAYLVLAYFGDNPKNKTKGNFTPISVCILPIVSKQHWNVPTHAHYRKTYLSLINAQSWYRKNKRLDIVITTPVNPITTANGVCMPEFIINLEDNTQILSLVPVDKNVYSDNQLKSIDIMNELAPVTEIDFTGVTNVSDHIYGVSKEVIKRLFTK